MNRLPAGGIGPSQKPVKWALLKATRLTGLHLGRLLAAVFFGALTQAASVALAGTSAWLIIRASQMPPVLSLQVAVVFVRTFGITRGVSRYIERLTAHRVALSGMTELRVRLYQRMAAGSPAAAASLRRGDILARIGADVEDVGDLVVRGIIPALVAAVLMVGSSAAVAIFLPPAGLALFICLALVAVGGPLLTWRAARLSERLASQARAAVATSSLDILENASELRVSGHLRRAMDGLAGHERRLFKATDATAKPTATAAFLTEAATGLALLACLVLGAWAFARGQINAVELGVITLMPMAAFESVAVLPGAAAQVFRSRMAARRIIALADAGQVAAGSPGPGRPSSKANLSQVAPDAALHAQDLACGWPGEAPVLRGVDLTLSPGQSIGLVGPSGAGKTTLLATLAGLLEPAGGRACVGQADLSGLDPGGRASTVAYIAEDAHIFATTVLENLRVARGDVTADEAVEVLETAGLSNWLQALPDGLASLLGGGGTTVSGGERRRLLLARALLSPARFILLDEPAEHLDPATANRLTSEIMTAATRAGRGVLMVSHRLSALTTAGLILVLGDGKVVESGTHLQLMERSAAYRLAMAGEEKDN